MRLPLLLALALALPARAQVKNPDTYTYVTINDADSLDPAWSYDTASHMIILNVYETLFAFEGSSTEKLVPRLAEKVPSRANGLISKDGLTYRIPIRKGVKFHDGTPLSAEDVRFSIMRFMLFDRDAGPSPLLLQPLLGYESTRGADGVLKPSAFRDAARAVSVEGNAVVLRLPKPFAPVLTILAQWSPAVSKSWAAANGDWDGTEAGLAKFNNGQKQSSPFFERANGTGAFRLARWDRKNKEFVLERFDGYWRAPAKLARIIVRAVPELGTRKLMLSAGDADSIYARSPEFSQLQNLPGVKIVDQLPMVALDPVAFFVFHINPVGNPYVGSGRLDGDGIPPDFFSDADVRKGFAYAFDDKRYISDVFRGKGSLATGCVPKGLLGHNPGQRTYDFDPEQAKAHFQKAWGGKVWEQGFRFTLTYNTGNVERETLCQILKRSVEGLNPKFRIDVRPVEWPTFMDSYRASKLPIFAMGWTADYPDPHDFAFPLMHSKGDFPLAQHYANPAADKVIDAAISETDPAKRRALYYKLQQIEYEDVPHLVFIDAVQFRTQRDWVRGWVHNPIFPDSPWGSYFYPISKAAAAAKDGR